MKWYKVISIVVLFFTIVTCSSCSNGIQEFGNVEFVGVHNSLYTDTTFFLVEEELYVDVGAFEDSIPLGNKIAAKNALDQYSFVFYSIPGYDQILVCNAISKINMINMKRIYASKNCEGVPFSLLKDYPQSCNLDGKKELEIKDEIYSPFGTACKALALDEAVMKIGDIEYYAITGYTEWIATNNKKNSGYWDIYYSNQKTTEIPSEILWSIVEL